MESQNFLKKFEDLTLKAANLEQAIEVVANKPSNLSEELSGIESDIAEIRELENEVKFLNC